MESKLNDEQDLEIWEHINLDKLDIKALYRYIKLKESNVHVTNKDGYSLLYLAAYNKNVEALRILLLQPNMDVNRLNGPHHEIALHAACSKGLFDGVELLIDNGSKLDVKDSLGHTPLTNAIFSNSLACVELLLSAEKGADVTVTDEQDNNLLHLAATNNFSTCIPLLVQKRVPIDDHNQRGLSPLAIAISFGFIETAFVLIDNGADVNGKTHFATVLHHAVTWNRLEIIKKLVEKGCNPNVVNMLEETPLYLAVQQRKIDIVRYLIEEAKADPCYMLHNPNNTTNLPLLYAANHGYTEMSKLLLTPRTSTFFIQISADMSQRVGHQATEDYLRKSLTQQSMEDATPTPTTTVNNTNSEKDDDVAFASLFNTFSDEE
ncbi:ankyrin repeat-containing domain protein [Gilbertella persicaria]|uniref:ankyrin repeat-containing domain protein n=1 Tax=Gilbertella persicaria TaxID=101096 RepID=UPI00221EF6A4|nr:ankyrin repeat-containing domain protein [Gilbertella persicaria]KAI8091362.1 ankyrin repeat-containing domain protein [Gilbertella persicaria]